MTKEITKAFILQQLQDKFALREFEREVFTFSEQVIPTYDVGQHLLKSEIVAVTKSITSGPDPYLFFRAAESEKWHIHRYNVIFVTGSYTVAGVMVLRPAIADYIYTDLKAAQSVSYAIDLPKDVVLGPGEWLAVYVDGYVSTGDLTMIIDVTKEEIR